MASAIGSAGVPDHDYPQPIFQFAVTLPNRSDLCHLKCAFAIPVAS
jgi:hypothetical protein